MKSTEQLAPAVMASVHERAAEIENWLIGKGKATEETLSSLSQGKLSPATFLLPAVLRNTDDRRYNRHPLTGISTGFPVLDIALRGGYQRSMYYVVLALQKAGKTNWLVYQMLLAAMAKVPVAFFEQEMTALELYERMASMLSGVPSIAVALGGYYSRQGERIGDVTPQEYDLWYAALDTISRLPIYIREGVLPASRVGAEVLALNKNVDFIITDYLQKHGGEGDLRQNVSGSSNVLRNLALDMNIPVLTASQANRSVHEDKDKRIKPHQSLGSSDIESTVTHLFGWQNEALLLDPNQRPDLQEGDFELMLNRTGWTTSVRMAMNAQTGLFSPIKTTEEEFVAAAGPAVTMEDLIGN